MVRWAGWEGMVGILPALTLLLAAAGAPEPLEDPVVTDPSSINVCERVPGVDVAEALGKALRSERPIVFKDSKLSRCVYILGSPAPPDGPTEGLVLWLYAPNDYADLNKLRLLRRGRFSLETTAADAASALALARLALDRFDR